MKARTLLAGSALSVFVLASINAMGSAQVPDVIIMDGRNESLDTSPLAPYLSAHPKVIPKSDDPATDNLRGYVATWEILDGKLFLRRIDVAFRNPRASLNEESRIIKNVIHKIFPDSRDLVAGWYSGALIIPRGKLVKYVHMGYGSTYESYTIVTVDKGVVSKSSTCPQKILRSTVTRSSRPISARLSTRPSSRKPSRMTRHTQTSLSRASYNVSSPSAIFPLTSAGPSRFGPDPSSSRRRVCCLVTHEL